MSVYGGARVQASKGESSFSAWRYAEGKTRARRERQLPTDHCHAVPNPRISA